MYTTENTSLEAGTLLYIRNGKKTSCQILEEGQEIDLDPCYASKFREMDKQPALYNKPIKMACCCSSACCGEGGEGGEGEMTMSNFVYVEYDSAAHGAGMPVLGSGTVDDPFQIPATDTVAHVDECLEKITEELNNSK